MRRFFYDTEFIEDGTTIDLVSIGVVDENGREFYAVSTEFDPARAGLAPWCSAPWLVKQQRCSRSDYARACAPNSALLEFVIGASLG